LNNYSNYLHYIIRIHTTLAGSLADRPCNQGTKAFYEIASALEVFIEQEHSIL